MHEAELLCGCLCAEPLFAGPYVRSSYVLELLCTGAPYVLSSLCAELPLCAEPLWLSAPYVRGGGYFSPRYQLIWLRFAS